MFVKWAHQDGTLRYPRRMLELDSELGRVFGEGFAGGGAEGPGGIGNMSNVASVGMMALMLCRPSRGPTSLTRILVLLMTHSFCAVPSCGPGLSYIRMLGDNSPRCPWWQKGIQPKGEF